MAAAALTAALLLLSPAGSAVAQEGSGGGSLTDKIKGWFTGPPASPGTEAPSADPTIPCPPVDIRQGASTITIYGPGEQAATNVRYQATIADMARECAFPGASMTMKVGVQGRVILGPVATPGKLDLPLRVALVHEGPEPKTLWTKLYRVPVTIAAGQPNVPFVHVEGELSVPKPNGEDAESYIVYVGFDQLGAKDDKGKKPRAR